MVLRRKKTILLVEESKKKERNGESWVNEAEARRTGVTECGV